MRFALPGGRGGLDPRGPVPTLELARVADESGYECLWFAEQQLNTAGPRYQRSPLVAAAAVAAVTSRIRVGFSALLPALHDPVRLAGDIATLDALSGGRVNLGVGWPDPRLPNPFARRGEAEATLPDRLDTLLGYWAGQRRWSTASTMRSRRRCSSRTLRCMSQRATTMPSPGPRGAGTA